MPSMVTPAVRAFADGLSGAQRLQVVAVLLGLLVLVAVVLLAERRNHGEEVVPPGMTPAPSPRQVYRPPARVVPTLAGRAAEVEVPGEPYPVPFIATDAATSEPTPTTGDPGSEL
jgi:hypothetical protein